MRRPPRIQPGMTAVELIGAMALASLLMLAVLNVSASVLRRPIDSPVAADQAQWAQRIADQVERDLLHAGAIDVAGDRIAITTLVPIGQTTHMPAEVRYQIKEIDNHRCLLRTVIPLTSHPNSSLPAGNPESREGIHAIAAVGVAAIGLTPIDAGRFSDDRDEWLGEAEATQNETDQDNPSDSFLSLSPRVYRLTLTTIAKQDDLPNLKTQGEVLDAQTILTAGQQRYEFWLHAR